MSLIYAAGVYESRGRIRGLVSVSGDGFLFGSYGGMSQSRLSKAVNPPSKLPYVAPIHSLAGRSFSDHGIRRQSEAVPSDGFDFCGVCSGAACLFSCSAVLQLVGSSKETQELGTQVHVSTLRGAHRSAHPNAGQSTPAAFTRATRQIKWVSVTRGIMISQRRRLGK